MTYTNLDKAMDNILALEHEVVRATRKLIDQIDDPNTTHWSAKMKQERLDVLSEIQRKMHDPCDVIRRHRNESKEAQRLAELRETDAVKTYLAVSGDATVQEYIRLAKETS